MIEINWECNDIKCVPPNKVTFYKKDSSETLTVFKKDKDICKYVEIGGKKFYGKSISYSMNYMRTTENIFGPLKKLEAIVYSPPTITLKVTIGKPYKKKNVG